jgi:AcrR family transcriptional regulator
MTPASHEVKPETGEEEIPENARKLLDAAVTMFARKGYTATSVREIVAEAGVTNPMLYYYFDSKEGLYRALFETSHESLWRAILKALTEANTFEEAVDAIIWGHMERATRSPDLLAFAYAALFGPSEGTPEVDFVGAREDFIEEVQSAFRDAQERGDLTLPEGIDLEEAIELLFGLINQQLIRALKESEKGDDETRRASLMRPFLDKAACRRLRRFYFRGLGMNPTL